MNNKELQCLKTIAKELTNIRMILQQEYNITNDDILMEDETKAS